MDDVQQGAPLVSGRQIAAIEQQVAARTYRLAQCGQR